MAKRSWKKWPGRFGSTIESTSGAVALAGGLAGAGAAVVAAPLVAVVGGLVLGGALLFAAVKSFPPLRKTAGEMLGQKVTLDLLADVDPPPLRLAIVGSTQTGKSTFLSAAQQKAPTNSRTNKIYAEIMILPTNPPTYAALLDGDGKAFIQQFEIAREAEFLIFFVDHNNSATDGKKSDARLAEHDQFIAQMETTIQSTKRVPRLHLLLNKRDIWQNGGDERELEVWFKKHASEWKRLSLSDDFTSDTHSNMITSDGAKVMEQIRTYAASRGN